ncbi:hypothetical protein ACET3X_003854 [Alternaria dauci]|uniref:Fungal N-terminal domain-containing protein n=1 Tax=Alternaria dauci TaxID=48095 RepID=A0ABR3UMG7_9PLEO
MAEVVGLVASVVQLAGAGLKLSQALYQYADGVATADRRIKNIANEVRLTSLVIQELGGIFEQHETASLISENAVRTAKETIKECSAVFTEIEVIIDKTKPGKMGRLMLPFRDNKIEVLRSQIDKLKSTLELLMQVLIFAQQVSSNKLSREAEAKQRKEITHLRELAKQTAKRYEESLRSFSISDDSTAVDDDERSLQEGDGFVSPSDLFKAASSISSMINPETLATCVNHVQTLLADIETLQLALATKVDGDDHSDHHQKAIGSYFMARSHLDSVLLGNSKVNITSTQTQQLIDRTSTRSTASELRRERTPDTVHEKSPNRHTSAASSAKTVAKDTERVSVSCDLGWKSTGPPLGTSSEEGPKISKEILQKLAQEELRREERTFSSARDNRPPKRLSLPSLPPPQSTRDGSRSPSGPYLIEERRPFASIGVPRQISPRPEKDNPNPNLVLPPAPIHSEYDVKSYASYTSVPSQRPVPSISYPRSERENRSMETASKTRLGILSPFRPKTTAIQLQEQEKLQKTEKEATTRERDVSTRRRTSKQKMVLGEFLGDQSLGSWADGMEEEPKKIQRGGGGGGFGSSGDRPPPAKVDEVDELLREWTTVLG